MSSARSTSSAARFAKTASARRSAETEAPRIGRTAQRTANLRTTVDLTPADHRRLRRIAEQLAEDLDAAEIPRRAVWLALLAELDQDPALYARVRERIRDDREGAAMP